MIVGTLGYSYGGGFQWALEKLEPRIDTIVPNTTSYSLVHALLPGDTVKGGFDSLLCTVRFSGNINPTPILASLCNLLGPNGPTAATLRTRTDLTAAVTMATAMPRPARDAPGGFA